jgi:hypothetical protein
MYLRYSAEMKLKVCGPKITMVPIESPPEELSSE